jgi:hypothetical protein
MLALSPPPPVEKGLVKILQDAESLRRKRICENGLKRAESYAHVVIGFHPIFLLKSWSSFNG